LAKAPDPERAYREVVLPEKLALAREYVRTQSFILDLKILARTLLGLFRR
jgi:lipopolysaccharide/colanic/teichoic acid biosynthesis glycosyltransferase